LGEISHRAPFNRDRIGVELFEFKGQENPEDNFEYWKTGVFHFCLQDPNVEELAERIVAAGGKSVWKNLVIITLGKNHIA
jgi:hypothetical protein